MKPTSIWVKLPSIVVLSNVFPHRKPLKHSVSNEDNSFNRQLELLIHVFEQFIFKTKADSCLRCKNHSFLIQ